MASNGMMFLLSGCIRVEKQFWTHIDMISYAKHYFYRKILKKILFLLTTDIKYFILFWGGRGDKNSSNGMCIFSTVLLYGYERKKEMDNGTKFPMGTFSNFLMLHCSFKKKKNLSMHLLHRFEIKKLKNLPSLI